MPRRKCLLVHTPNVYESQSGELRLLDVDQMASGLLGLADYLTAHADTRVLHVGVERARDASFKVDEFVRREGFDAVGISLHWAKTALSAIELARAIKSTNPGIVLFLGGFTASYFAEEILENFDFVDAVIRGDAEEPVARLLSGDRHEDVPNLVWRRDDLSVVDNGTTYVACPEAIRGIDIANLDLMYHHEQYEPSNWSVFRAINKRKTYFMSFGRGCPYVCTYCGGNRDAQRTIANRRAPMFLPVETVADACERLVRDYGFRSVYNGFAPFPNNPRLFFADFFAEVKRRKLDFAYCHDSWGLPSEETLLRIKETFEVCQVGISAESGMESIRRANKSPALYFSNRQLEDRLEFMRRHEILGVVYFSYFLPRETEEQLASSLEYFDGLAREYKEQCQFSYYPLTCDPGSKVFEEPGKYGMYTIASTFRELLRSIADLNGDDEFENLQLAFPKWMSPGKAREILGTHHQLRGYKAHGWHPSLRDSFLRDPAAGS